MSSKPRALLCVPCYRESARLPIFLEQIKAQDRPLDFAELTVLFLDDGSGEAEQDALKNLLARSAFTNFKIESKFFEKNRGKGGVLRDGFKEGLRREFDLIGFLDSDGATPFYEGLALLEEAWRFPQLDGVIGSRVKCLGKTVERSFKRHLVGRVFATLLSNLYDIPVYDSQCGAKIFRKRALTAELLDRCYDDRWLFDTQLLILLFRNGRSIREQMIDWTDIPGSKINVFRDSWRMFVGLLRFRRSLG
jgi:glycosyltransferase involved in cell wall biosynthesis